MRNIISIGFNSDIRCSGRVKYLVELLLKKGYIKSFQSGEDKTLYVITGEGRKFYHDKLKDVLDLLK